MVADSLVVQTLEGEQALDHLGVAFDDLSVAAAAPLTARRLWLSCWAHHHIDWTPWIVTVRRAGLLRATAALARRTRHGVVHVAMLGVGQSDYAWLPVREPADAPDLAEAVEAALRGLRRPWVAHLEQLPFGDPVLTSLTARLRNCELEPGDPSQVVSFTSGTDLRLAVPKRTRATVRLARNRLARERVRLEVSRIRDSEEVRALLPEIAGLRTARNIDKGLPGDHANDAARGFWYEVIRLLAGRGEIEVAVVRLDGRLASYSVALLDPPAYRVWDTRIAPDLRVYSPGHLLRDVLMEWLHLQPGWSELDMMRGTEPYKNAIAPQLRETVSLRAWSSPLLRLPRQARRTLATIRDRHPAMVRLDRATRQVLRGTRRAH